MVDHTKRFRHLDASTRERKLYLEMVDAIYRAQVLAAEKEMMIVRSRRFNKKHEVTDEELQKTIDHFLESYIRFCSDVAGHPVLCYLGSARDEAVSAYGVKLNRALAKLAVSRNLGISSGDWFHGYMGVPKYLWLKEKMKYDHGWAYSTAVALGGQEITLRESGDLPLPQWFTDICVEDNLDPKQEWKMFTTEMREERRSPPHVSFLSRTTSIYFPPQAVGKAYAASGGGTLEELKRFRLSRQMAPRNLTADSWRPASAIPWDFILDEPMAQDQYSLPNQDEWAYDFLLAEILMQARKKTLCVEENEGLAIIRVTEEEPSFKAPDFYAQRWVDSEQSLDEVLRYSKTEDAKRPFLLYFASFELAAEFVIERSYITHRTLAKSLAENMMLENGAAGELQ